MTDYINVFKKAFQFSGRSRRREYWTFTLIQILIISVLSGIAFGSGDFNTMSTLTVIMGIYGLITFIPSWALLVRRLHDTDKSGWFMLVTMIPIIGSIWLLIVIASAGTNGHNQWGEDPKVIEAVTPEAPSVES